MARNNALGRPTLKGFLDPSTTATRNGNIVNVPMYPQIGGFDGPQAYRIKNGLPIVPPGGRGRSTRTVKGDE